MAILNFQIGIQGTLIIESPADTLQTLISALCWGHSELSLTVFLKHDLTISYSYSNDL